MLGLLLMMVILIQKQTLKIMIKILFMEKNQIVPRCTDVPVIIPLLKKNIMYQFINLQKINKLFFI